jgi:hypothetical protein
MGICLTPHVLDRAMHEGKFSELENRAIYLSKKIEHILWHKQSLSAKKEKALELIELGQDAKYQKKYSKVWKK